MNPSPDRGKECLPPKKRESRQGSVEHHITLDEFKPPVPLRSRPSAGRGDGGREALDRERALTDPNPHLLHTPPSLPAPAPCLPLSLPWHLSYSPSVSHPLFPGQVAERRGSGSPVWRDDPLSSPLPHSSRWLRGDSSLSLPPSSSSPSASSFKTPFPADSREMWPYVNSGRRDYSSSLFSPSYLFGPHSLYPQDPSLVEARHRYLGKRPNGLDGLGSRTVSAPRPLLTGEYVNDGSRARVDFGPHSSHTNGGRRHQEDPTSRGTYLSDAQTQEDPEPHSSLQDRHPHGLVKTGSNLLSTSPHPLVPDPRAGRGGPLDPMGATPAEAHIYYSLGSGCHPSPQPYPPYSPSGTPLYSLHREPGPRQHSLRNSPHSPLGPSNSHDRSHRDQERDREKVALRDKDRGKDKEKHSQRDEDQERGRERERRRDRERESSPSSFHSSPPAPHPSPPALLPHFTKGSLIELASGRLKRVEELRTDDFLRSADSSSEFHLSSCTVLLISPSSAQGFSHLQVHLTDRNTQEILKVLAEYPFFVQDRGWSSCCPQRTTQLYGLPCRQLTEGDVCLALTPKPAQSHRTLARSGSRAHRVQPPARAAAESGGSHREEMPPPPPPPPLPHHPHPAAPAPPRTLAADPPAREQPRPRKRRWSAPDALASTATDESLLDLPHGSKLMKWQ
ncbi:mediator of RNA polymerase II transcription subunit 1.1 [Scophthalmus maximus]|uniref:mediator of RNA polymerase II transcription subunit 1.1 n=1 Tax=Scophthalmus maximus TaxID=52904 RepID=UPI001FA8EADC|nr:mediator of RNA polymerase II transcription subunit 1.1 [Scophthalmus maximus]XP_035500590.2 mediator of RNA polymerase II transcription subunit 1.1 [Scophthalmus maximus]XP_035500591.2 mediator of RNA polymerase II transcription subunit 1.1 [Scophthalmus maximus]XP_035500592.2 mediator of RNA polymerase II transcription subunit 1.1 [Scophthalmus maximus]XP_035500593.2 mediator of RNA polymerase II transcription subunit 1.1 [Scophthalmus maximus]XP_035500595.2 mediator of RNA polymerase II 